MLMTALFLIAKRWKHPTCPLTGERIYNLGQSLHVSEPQFLICEMGMIIAPHEWIVRLCQLISVKILSVLMDVLMRFLCHSKTPHGWDNLTAYLHSQTP